MSEILKTAATETTTPAQAPAGQPEPNPVKTFTQDELDKIIDRRLARERADAETRMQNAITEAQKLAKMNAEERAKHEQQKAEEALKGREQEITRRELRAQARETLSEKGIPLELADVLPYTDADATNTAITAVEKAFRAAVEKGVNDRLKGTPPAAGTTAPPTGQREKLIADYNAAEKAKDSIRMITIADQIHKLPKKE